jgi:hypothetical protein
MICGSYTIGSVKNDKEMVLWSLMGDEISMRGYRELISIECKIIVIVVLLVMSDLGSSLD